MGDHAWMMTADAIKIGIRKQVLPESSRTHADMQVVGNNSNIFCLQGESYFLHYCYLES